MEERKPDTHTFEFGEGQLHRRERLASDGRAVSKSVRLEVSRSKAILGDGLDLVSENEVGGAAAVVGVSDDDTVVVSGDELGSEWSIDQLVDVENTGIVLVTFDTQVTCLHGPGTHVILPECNGEDGEN